MTNNCADLMMVTFNRLDLTKQTLESLFETTDFPFNLIVVDNGSSDGTLDYLYKICGDKLAANSSNFLSFKIIKNETNLGIAVGRNQALQASESKWLSTLDNDVKMPNGWLTNCIKILSANPSYGMIGVNMEEVDYPLISIGELVWQNKVRGNLGTACTVFNRTLHKLLGYFNTQYEKKYSMEDSDFGARVRVAGLKMGYLSERGEHLGVGEADKGEYREWKTACHQANLKKFNENCAAYFNNRKSIYFPFKM